MTAHKTDDMTVNFNTLAPAMVKPYVKPAYPHAHLPMLTASDVPNTALMHNLYRALHSRRAADSMAEARYVAWLCNRLPVTMIDSAGNIHVDMRTGPMHRTMFTSHTDTVHRQGGTNKIRLDASNPKSVKWRADEGAALGADDGAGIALMQYMITAGVPALYVFFRNEECGGLGSSWLANHMPDTLKDIDRCISFDRADYSDVITHQGMGRCCSDKFAEALAAALTADDMSTAFMPDDTGVFTDSANLTGIVGECTNLSVGYKNQHGDGEWQDITFLGLLADQLVRVQWDDLPVVRAPGEDDRWGQMLKGTNVHLADATQEYLIDALYAAGDEDYAALRGIVSEWVNPAKPEESLRLIDPKRMHWSDYRDMAESLTEGVELYENVLDMLTENLITN